MKRLYTLFIITSLTLSLTAQTLHYDRPAQYFEEALPIGNGRIGGMVYSGTNVDRISLNDITLWTGEPDHSVFDSMANAIALRGIREALMQEDYPTAERLQRQLQGHYSENYQPLGTLHIEYDHTSDGVKQYKRWLNIGNATAGNSYQIGKQHYSTEYFCSHPDQVMVVKIKSSGEIRFRLRLDTPLPHETFTEGDDIIANGYAAYHSLPVYYHADTMFYYSPDRGIHFRTVARVLGAQSIQQEDSTLFVRGNKEVIILIANATSFNGFDKDPVKEGADYKNIVDKQITQACNKTYAGLRGSHIRDYQNFYNRVELQLGRTAARTRKLPTDEQLKRYTRLEEHNPDLEELYFQFGRYLLISSSRTEGVPATLQGLWNEQMLPPWSSNYTTNINLEENYWPAEVANLSEMHQPLLSFLKNLSINGKQTALNMYGAPSGWCLAHNSDIWAMTNPVGLQTGDPKWACWNMGGAWLSTHVWEHYLFTRDYDFLKEYYPILKGAAEFCLNILLEKDGHLITAPCTSPENQYVNSNGFYGSTFYGGTADKAIIWECLNDTRLASQALGVDYSFQQKLDSTISRLTPYRVGSNGQLLEWYHDWQDAERTHRHQSHLFGLYPGNSILYNMPEAAACKRTLELRGDETTGWSTGWRINLYARLHDGENAYHMFRKLLRYVSPDNYTGEDAVRGGGTYPNLMDAHSPFQIDGNFGGCAGVCEMLLQSFGEFDTLRPALPKAWKHGHVKGLRSRTGKSITIKW